MKTILATAALTVMFLSAGASANNDGQAIAVASSPVVNITVISKTSQWPAQVDACKLRQCLDA